MSIRYFIRYSLVNLGDLDSVIWEMEEQFRLIQVLQRIFLGNEKIDCKL